MCQMFKNNLELPIPWLSNFFEIWLLDIQHEVEYVELDMYLFHSESPFI